MYVQGVGLVPQLYMTDPTNIYSVLHCTKIKDWLYCNIMFLTLQQLCGGGGGPPKEVLERKKKKGEGKRERERERELERAREREREREIYR